MDITPITFAIICPICFLSGILNASGGGGGLLSLPIFLIAGLPPHLAIGTNKLQTTLGMFVTNIRYMRSKLLDLHLAAISIPTAVLGSFLGSNLSMLVDEKILLYVIFAVLPLALFFVLRSDVFQSDDTPEEKVVLTKRVYITAAASALVIGAYDGFYGPGTGTFLILAFTALSGMGVRQAGAQAKAINFVTNLTALVVFLFSGEVIVVLGLAGGVCNMLGSWIGAGLVIRNGSKVMKPMIIIALALLLLKALGLY